MKLWAYDLREALEARHRVLEGIRLIDYPKEEVGFDSVLRLSLHQRYGIDRTLPLTQLHKGLEHRIVQSHKMASGHWMDNLEDLGPEVVRAFHRFVKWLAGHLGSDLIFQRNPLVRYHVPGRLGDRYRLADGTMCTFHSDTLLLDPFQQINVWLPLCDVKSTAALNMVRVEPSLDALHAFCRSIEYDVPTYREGRDTWFHFLESNPAIFDSLQASAAPVDMDYGQCLLFDPRSLHGTADNQEDETRVSIDFRVLLLEDYEAILNEAGGQGSVIGAWEGESLEKGGYYHSLTAMELDG